MPERVQLKRSKGWRIPEGTVKVDRSTRWGNPYTPADCASVETAVARHPLWMRGEAEAPDGRKPPEVTAIRCDTSAAATSVAGALWTARAMPTC